jgi:hypothetical protein
MVGFRAEKTLIFAIDAAVAAEGDQPSRAEMIRRIVVAWLSERGYLQLRKANDQAANPDP